MIIAEPPSRERAEPHATPKPPLVRATTLLASFGYAFAGLYHLLRTQRNAQIHCAIGLLALALGLFFGISRLEWIALVLTCALVLAAEGVNTAIEAVVDLASPEIHPLAKTAKDVAAGTVLLAAIASVIVGLLIFLPYLLDLLGLLLHT